MRAIASAAAAALRSSIGRPMTLPSTTGSDQRSMDATLAVNVRRGSDIRFALASQRDGAGLGQLAGDLQNLFLRALDFGDAHRALGLEVVLQHFGGPL